MSIYEYPDLFFPGLEMEAYANPPALLIPDDSGSGPKESRLDKYLQALVDLLERISGAKRPSKQNGTVNAHYNI